MNKVICYLLLSGTLLASCKGKGPVTIDYEIANATLVGRETCSSEASLNAWLVDLGPTFSGKTTGTYYGREATLNGKHYAHVVKTHSPLVRDLDSTRQYVFSFYVEDVLPTPSCTLPITTVVNVPQIRVIEASFRAP